MGIGSLTLDVHVDCHGAMADTRIGIIRRTVALWLIAAAQRLLRSRMDITLLPPKGR